VRKRLILLVTVLLSGAVYANFPTGITITETLNTTGGNPAIIDNPATVNSGDLLIVTLSTGNSVGAITVPAGWTLLAEGLRSGIATWTGYRISDGTEGGTTISFSLQFGATETAGQVYRIENWHGTTPPEISVYANGGNTNPDPTAVTASWGVDDNTFITIVGVSDDDSSVSTWPTDYTVGQTSTIVNNTVNASCRIFSARRDLAADTDDPSAFTLSESENWTATTVVVRGFVVSATNNAIFHYNRQLLGEN